MMIAFLMVLLAILYLVATFAFAGLALWVIVSNPFKLKIVIKEPYSYVLFLVVSFSFMFFVSMPLMDYAVDKLRGYERLNCTAKVVDGDYTQISCEGGAIFNINEFTKVE